ncbi:hypothetical protein K438DRAFT_1804066 [Mycena galopus ATCC 62051]|nr:hypothetical protein K438DRAFT_1804066 [Mycena galopus ATCC 62051]
MISVLTLFHRSNNLGRPRFACPRNLPLSFLADSFPMPIPAQECNVHPPMFIAAMPVDAVIPSVSPRSCNSLIISRSSTDFPVPADPEKNMLSRRFIRSRTAFCSSERITLEVLASLFKLWASTGGASVGGSLNLAVRLYGFWERDKESVEREEDWDGTAA